jgi:NTE family protein
MSLVLFRRSVPDPIAHAPSSKKLRPRIGVALGAGVARGWAHIGAMRELVDLGIVPDVVVGASIGAVVGGCFAGGRLDALEEFARSLTRRSVFSLIDVSLRGGGLMGGDRLRQRLEAALGQQRIENLPTRFVAVATEMKSGHEVWLKSGPVSDALRASYALPGIFEPVKLGGRWLFDGAIVNPVPVNVARAFGAEYVLALTIAGDTPSGAAVFDSENEIMTPTPAASSWPRWLGGGGGEAAPGVASVMVHTFNITQDRIMRSRLAGDPPDHTVAIKAKAFGLFEFHRAAELIELGRLAVRKAAPEILEHLEEASAG